MLIKKDIKYVSEYTEFMRGFLDQNPEVAKDQVAGRGLLWDREQDREFLKQAEAVRVKQKPYVYMPE